MICTSPYRVTSERGDLFVRCGQCMACRQARASIWATRLNHEALYWKRSCFFTLTYDDEHLPDDRGLDKEEIQRFMKRLRKNTGRELKYYIAGEYGTQKFRPHYHGILYGVDYKEHNQERLLDGSYVIIDGPLKDAWKYGNINVGDVCTESAGYVAQYCLTKLNGKRAKEVYCGRQPPFQLFSRGLGLRYVEEHFEELKEEPTLRKRENVIGLPRAYRDKMRKLGHDVTEQYKKFARENLAEIYEYHLSRGKEIKLKGHKMRLKTLDLQYRSACWKQAEANLEGRQGIDQGRKEL